MYVAFYYLYRGFNSYIWLFSSFFKQPSTSTAPPPTPPKPVPVLAGPDKKAAQAIGVSLRNLLKLPKAHKWVCYEWFYANIDE